MFRLVSEHAHVPGFELMFSMQLFDVFMNAARIDVIASSYYQVGKILFQRSMTCF